MSTRQALLTAERIAIRAAHCEWLVAHDCIHDEPFDLEMHRVHGEQLRLHTQRLPTYSAAMGGARLAI